MDAVVALPEGAFSPFTSVRSSILLLRRDHNAKRVRMVDASYFFEPTIGGYRTSLPKALTEQLAGIVKGNEYRHAWNLSWNDLAELEWDLTPRRREKGELSSLLGALRDGTRSPLEIALLIDKALDLVWGAELPTQKIPSEWFDVWKRAGEKSPSDWDEQFPRRRGHQIRLLQLLTGTDKSDARAKFVTKNTYALANAAQTFGDFGQHLDGAKVEVGVAFTALTVCIELAAALERELPGK